MNSGTSMQNLKRNTQTIVGNKEKQKQKNKTLCNSPLSIKKINCTWTHKGLLTP